MRSSGLKQSAHPARKQCGFPRLKASIYEDAYPSISEPIAQAARGAMTRVYHIRVQGHLDLHWSAWFDGMTITHMPNGQTTLVGPVLDQGALHGLLTKMRDLGLPLVALSHEEVIMLNAIRHLDYVVLLCDDMQRMKQFYRDVMGFPIHRDWGYWVELRVGSVLLALRARADFPFAGPRFQRGSVGVQLAFRVTPAEVDACYAELRERGVEILEPPISKDYGHKTLFFKDPDGNVLEIYADL